MKYRQLLEIEYQLKLALRKAQTEWDSYTGKYGTDSILYRIGHDEVKALRQSLKDLDQAVELLRANKLYSHD